jgi:hypothetical protein
MIVVVRCIEDAKIFLLLQNFAKQTLTPYPRPSTVSVFVQIVLSSKWTGGSLKGYRQNCQEETPR